MKTPTQAARFAFLSAALAICVPASHAALTQTYVSIDGGGSGLVRGDTNAVSSVTLLDSDGGDMWTGGDQFQYLHTDTRVTGDFSATTRYLGSTEAIDGRWGKGGIRASQSLAGDSTFAMTQIAQGNGSQPGGANPVPVRLAGRFGNIDQMFEDPITLNTGGEVQNNTSVPQWLRLDYEAATNSFTAGWAADIAGVPGEWHFSAPRTDIATDGGGWFVGLAYSAHDDLNFTQVTDPSGLHGATFESFVIPEPTSALLLGVGTLGLLALRRRRRG
ncbi:hypothetical protein BH23VER1_BH23VER1_34080 [soil metagenome]